MMRNRFFKLKNHLTIVDNNSVSEDDKTDDRLWKVRPFIERVRKTCLKLEKDQNVCIDEQSISCIADQMPCQAIHSAKAEHHRVETLRPCWSFWDSIRFLIVSQCRNVYQLHYQCQTT